MDHCPSGGGLVFGFSDSSFSCGFMDIDSIFQSLQNHETDRKGKLGIYQRRNKNRKT